MAAPKRRRKSRTGLDLDKIRTLHFRTDSFPPGIAGRKCRQSGIRIPDSKRQYERMIAAKGYTTVSPSDTQE